MLDNDIPLNPNSYGGANVSKTFSLVSLPGDGGRSVRRVAATSTTTPETLTVSHRQQSKNGGALLVDQHMVRVDKKFVDPVKGPVEINAWLVIQAPQGTSVATVAEIKDQVGRVLAMYMTATHADKILNGEP